MLFKIDIIFQNIIYENITSAIQSNYEYTQENKGNIQKLQLHSHSDIMNVREVTQSTPCTLYISKMYRC